MINIASAGTHHDWRQYAIWLATLAVAALSWSFLKDFIAFVFGKLHDLFMRQEWCQ